MADTRTAPQDNKPRSYRGSAGNVLAAYGELLCPGLGYLVQGRSEGVVVLVFDVPVFLVMLYFWGICNLVVSTGRSFYSEVGIQPLVVFLGLVITLIVRLFMRVRDVAIWDRVRD